MTATASPRLATPDVGSVNLDTHNPTSPINSQHENEQEELHETRINGNGLLTSEAKGRGHETRLHASPAPPSNGEVTTVNGINGNAASEPAEAPEAISEPPAPLTNGHTSPQPEDDSQRPAKRRKTGEASSQASPRTKPISPPWKRVIAEGPSSFTENGRRKSGRINSIPLELHPQGKKRLTRTALQNLQRTPTAKPRPSSAQSKSPPTAEKHLPQRSSRTVSSSRQADVKPPPPTRSSSRRLPPSPTPEKKQSTRLSTRRHTPPPQPTRQSTRVRRSGRHTIENEPTTPSGRGHDLLETTGRSPRIKLRVKLTALPLIHPAQANTKPKLGPTFQEFWTRAKDIPVEDGGLYASEDGPPYSDEIARQDARTILRIEDATEPGGILSEERCVVFTPAPQEEPARQWAHMDHLTRAMTNFRRLLLAEQVRHKATAKKLAEACRDEWVRRQPKSAEQLEREARDRWIGKYRIVAKAMFGTWENVRAEINRRRLQEWEAEEQKRVKAALNEAVMLSEQQLQARRAHFDTDSDLDTDDEELSTDDGESVGESDIRDSQGGSDGDDGDDEDDDDNMTSDEDDDEGQTKEDLADENLTQEQLRAKYADIPLLETGATQTDKKDEDEAAPTDDTSDESIDMDDDLGSTDLDSDDSGSDEVDGSESDGEPTGLLGLFFGKSELQQLQDEATDGENTKLEETSPSRTIMGPPPTPPPFPTKSLSPMIEELDDDDDEVSLIRQPDLDDPPAPPTRPQAESPLKASLQEARVNGARPPSEPLDGILDEKNTLETTCRDKDDAQPTAQFVPDDLKTIENLGHSSDVPVTEVDDVVMEDVPEPEPIPAVLEQLDGSSQEPDSNTEGHTAFPSQSPRTADTKPSASDVDTTSAGTLAVTKATSRSTTPQLPSNVPKTEVPFLLRGTLREYQHYGLDWLAGLYANNTNGILADEMGLGKTIQTIALLAHLACQHKVWGPHLVIVPTSVMLNWEMEFKKWCPGFKILAYYGSQEERKRKRQGWKTDDMWNVCITSYQLVLQDHQVFKRRRWHYMILDEAHNIKNFKSQRWQTLLGFNTHSRLLLTGTPLQNNLTELWSLLFFLMPAENGVGGFADLNEFHDWFHKPETQILESGREKMDDEARAIISKLHKVLRPYLLRRLKADVEKQMPAKYEHVELCRLSKRQRELYDGFLARADTRATLSSGNYLSIINCLMQLRKVCNHPDLFVDRPIMTSFRMARSVAGEYEPCAELVQKTILAENPMNIVSLGFLNLLPTQHERFTTLEAERVAQLSAHRPLAGLKEIQKSRAQASTSNLDPSTVNSNLAYLDSAQRWGRFEELQHCVYLNALRRQKRPIYGKNLVQMLTLDLDKPHRKKPNVPKHVMAWFEDEPTLIQSWIKGVDRRAAEMQTAIQKFACITPAAVTRDLDQTILGQRSVRAFQEEDMRISAPVRWAPFIEPEAPTDPWHEARMRLSIQFPDKRLLQYDCGKLQTLDKLLRKLQAGGHRALIFTQMTKVLDILERFLNIHGHKYLRLDGATKVEQRQILTDRFNHDTRILCFILSTRSGGLGINLTGADTVIFYDQDWNPAMDKQCQDRCHRIGQTRDVHIYRLVSEHTIEANILRKASQKQMLDDVVIQEGEFTTDYFNKLSVRDVLGNEGTLVTDGDAAANAAMDRVLGGVDGSEERNVGRVLEQAEDREDVTAAHAAEKETRADEEDFSEKPGLASGPSTERQNTPHSLLPDDTQSVSLPETEIEYSSSGTQIHTIDDYMLRTMAEQLKNTPLELPKDKKKGKKKGKDTRKR